MSLYQISSPVGLKEEFFAIFLCISKSSLVGKNATVLKSELIRVTRVVLSAKVIMLIYFTKQCLKQCHVPVFN